MIFSGTNVVLKMVPGAIDKMIDESGPIQWILSVGTKSRHDKYLSFDIGNQERGRLHAEEMRSPTRNLFDVGDSDKGHVC
jgi:hypothetical protein